MSEDRRDAVDRSIARLLVAAKITLVFAVLTLIFTIIIATQR